MQTMTTTICFLGGIGFQELLMILLFFFILGLPVVLIIVIVKIVSRNRAKPFESGPINTAQTPILKNASKLIELKSLLEKGIISNEEFEAEKKEILNS
jgi:hypothetical protein